MTTAIHSDNWFLRRIMKLACFEKRLINSPRHARHTQQTALALLEHVSLPPRPHCLEIGCGQGALARLMVERYGAQVVASDYDPAQVALAQERLADLDEQVELRVVDARAIPLDDAAFDAVFSFGVLHHILGGWQEAVVEIARVLRPGGWFVFTDLVLTPRAGRLMRRLQPWLLSRFDQLEEMALQECMAENGLSLEHYVYGQGEFMAVLGLMNYCTAVAQKLPETSHREIG
jgi:cyclopropane fatty-acyl-phospholipid synthase-like methyltransferase